MQEQKQAQEELCAGFITFEPDFLHVASVELASYFLSQIPNLEPAKAKATTQHFYTTPL